MSTISIGSQEIQAQEVARVGGYLDEKTNLEEVLHRTRGGDFFLEEVFTNSLPEPMPYDPDPDFVVSALAPRIRLRKIESDEAILKFVQMFTSDRAFPRLVEARLGLNASKAPRKGATK